MYHANYRHYVKIKKIIVGDMSAVFLKCFEFENSHWSVWND